ncbi:MAG: DUF2946 family protein [Casimicrobiaceae bacterium]|nr:DUF2946 family protein [Casimicrobiaceae bacterium]
MRFARLIQREWIRRALGAWALLSFLATSFGPSVAVALARAAGAEPLVVELCTSTGLKRVTLEQDAANDRSETSADARLAAGECLFCSLSAPNLAPPPAHWRWVPARVGSHWAPQSAVVARANPSDYLPLSRAPPARA